MIIGIDLDGVIFDSENTFRTYEEIFDIENNQNNLIDRSEPYFQGRYNWTDEQKETFIKKYFKQISEESPIMSGFKAVYELLKKENITFVVITARGGFVPELKDDAERILKANNIHFDKFYWKQSDKLDACKKENVDLMIDDNYRIIEKLASNGIKTLYFRDVGLKKLEENEYIKEVHNWGDVYRIIKNMLNNK